MEFNTESMQDGLLIIKLLLVCLIFLLLMPVYYTLIDHIIAWFNKKLPCMDLCDCKELREFEIIKAAFYITIFLIICLSIYKNNL